jgi:HSP20 family protein
MTTTLNRWNPFRPLEDLQQNLLTSLRPAGVYYPVNGDLPATPLPRSSWTPAMDVIEHDKGYTICAELPGMRKEDITVIQEQNVLTVRGENKTLRGGENEKQTWHVSERQFGNFERCISLPKDADASSLQAELKDGVLYLRLAKKEEALPRLIEVN